MHASTTAGYPSCGVLDLLRKFVERVSVLQDEDGWVRLDFYQVVNAADEVEEVWEPFVFVPLLVTRLADHLTFPTCKNKVDSSFVCNEPLKMSI